MADPISDAWTALITGNNLCIFGVIVGVVMLLLLIVILRIRKVQSEQSWAHNPDKQFKLRWRRG